VSPGAGLEAVVKRKFPPPAGTQTPDHPDRNPALYHVSPIFNITLRNLCSWYNEVHASVSSSAITSSPSYVYQYGENANVWRFTKNVAICVEFWSF